MAIRRRNKSNDGRMSIIDKIRSTPEGRRDSDGIRATFDAIKLIDKAMEESNTSRSELAEKLDVSIERVDEILDVWQGNVRITTLARILSVCGFTLSLSAEETE